MNTRFSFLFICLLVLANCSSDNQKVPTQQAINTQTTENWIGHYRGVLPCASCPGIDIEIKLYPDSTYAISRKYQGEDNSIFRDLGNFSWSDDRQNIILENENDSTQNQFYSFEEDKLVQLGQNGKKIESPLADKYILKKIPFTDAITEKYWRLIELRGQKVTMVEGQPKEVHLILKANSTTLLGFAGCNPMMGSYNIEAGNRIKFSKIAVTMRACSNLDSEKTFLNGLEQADNYAIKNDTLSLNKAKMSPLAKFEAVYLY